MKKILVPTDFSEHAYWALKAAAEIAKKFNSEIHLLHVLDMPQYSGSIGLVGVEAALAMREKMEGVGILTALDKEWDNFLGQPFLKGISVKKHTDFDGIYDSIKSFAEKAKIDMIVMGSHGARGTSEFFGGSNTEKVVRIVDTPVLVIKSDFDHLNVKNVVFASNFFGEIKDSFATLKRFVEGCGATLHLLKVITPGEFERTSKSHRLMTDFVEKFGIEKYTFNIYNDVSIEDGINGFVKQTKPDVVAISTHGYSGLARLLSGGSIAENMVNHASLPVLTIKISQPEGRYGVIFPD